MVKRSEWIRLVIRKKPSDTEKALERCVNDVSLYETDAVFCR